MAVPDPHIDELHILSNPPHPRTCKDLYKFPRRNDFIEVLWCMDHLPGMPDRWCPAEVLHVSTDHDRDVLALGIILYLPGEAWDEQVQEVEFLENKKLRCGADRNEDEDGIDQCDGNSELEWRFQRESVSESDREVSEDEWEPTQTQRRTSPENFSASNNTCLNRNTVLDELTSLREGHAVLVLQVEKLKRIVMSMSRNILEGQHRTPQEKICLSANCVLPRLRQKLVLRMQSAIKNWVITSRKRKNPSSDQEDSVVSVDGLRCDVMRAKVECTLRQFESVSRHISASAPSQEVGFFPSFGFTQLPSTSSTIFRVLFRTFSQLCESLGICSTADRKEMARKCGRSSVVEQLRMLGTYEFDESDEKKVARFYPGASCGATPAQPVSESEGSQNTVPGHCHEKLGNTYQAYTRTTREWDKVDQRYAHGLRKEFVTLPPLSESASDKQAFAVTWKRAGEIVGRGWSQSLCDSKEVFGWLEVTIPHITVQGRQLCQEFGGIVNDDIWDEILRATETKVRSGYQACSG